MKSQLNSTIRQVILAENAQVSTVGHLFIYRYFNSNALYYFYGNGSVATYFNNVNFFQNLDNQWIHIVIVCDYSNKVGKIYRNGSQLGAEINLTGTPLFPSVNRIKYIGAYSPTEYKLTDGSLDEVRIYNRGLSAEEIKKHYNILRFDKERQPGWHPIKK
jgi:hypothetical protein